MPSSFESYNMDGKLFIIKQYKSRIRPLLALGFALTSLTVEEGSTDGFSTDDARFKGWDFRFGGGIEISLHEHIAIDLLEMYRWGNYGEVDGIVSGRIDDDIDGNGFTGSVELKYLF